MTEIECDCANCKAKCTKPERVDLGWYRKLDDYLSYIDHYNPSPSKFPTRRLIWDGTRIVDVTNESDIDVGRKQAGDIEEMIDEVRGRLIWLKKDEMQLLVPVLRKIDDICDILRAIAKRLPS